MATTDYFGRSASTFGGGFSADDAKMFFPAIAGQQAHVPLLLQNVQFGYQQQITRLYELTSNAVYYVAGRAQGTGQLSQILGPARLSESFLRNYGSVCRANKNELFFEMTTGCVGDTIRSTQYFRAKFVVLNSVQINIAAESMLIQQGVGMMIGSLETDSSGSGVLVAP